MTDAPAAAGTHIRAATPDEEDLIEQLSACRAELAVAEELHRMQMVAISVCAGQNVPELQERIGKENPYWTPAYDDMCTAVDREVRERVAKGQSERLLTALWDNCTVIYWPKTEIGTYPIEHVMAAGKDSRLLILAALASKNSTK